MLGLADLNALYEQPHIERGKQTKTRGGALKDKFQLCDVFCDTPYLTLSQPKKLLQKISRKTYSQCLKEENCYKSFYS